MTQLSLLAFNERRCRVPYPEPHEGMGQGPIICLACPAVTVTYVGHEDPHVGEPCLPGLDTSSWLRVELDREDLDLEFDYEWSCYGADAP